MQSNTGAVDLTTPSHIGVVVKDRDKTVEFFQSNWGIGPWYDAEVSIGKEDMIVGESLKLKVAHAKLFGRLLLELIQPLEKGSIWSNFLETHGEGLQHIAYDVPNWQEMVSKLEAQGARMMIGAIVWGMHFFYLDTKPGGIIVEFAEVGLHAEQEKFLGLT